MPKLLTPLDKAALLAEEFAKVERETNKVEASYERGLLHHLGKALKDNKLALVCLVILCIIIFSSVFACFAVSETVFSFETVSTDLASCFSAGFFGFSGNR